jgi:integrase
MSWVPSTRRWKKMFRGRMYVVSCRQLGTDESKDASWRAANDWWESQQGQVETPGEDDRIARARQVSRLVQDFGNLDDEARRQAVEELLGAGSYDTLKSKAGIMLAGMETSSPERTIAAQIESWKGLLRSACQSKQLSEGRYDAYCRNIGNFSAWIGPENSIDAIDESRLEAFYGHLSSKVAAGDYSPQYAHTLLMTAKQFIKRLASLRLTPLPGNIADRRFRFNHSAATVIETFTPAEVKDLLGAANDRTRLYLLLMLNCGMYQNDIAELRPDEVDWAKGTITRARSKTRERKGPVTTYKLWPETMSLLRQNRVAGELVLVTEKGNLLVSYKVTDGVFSRYDAIQSSWNRLGEKMGGKIRLSMKHLRKTSASMLGEHPQFKFYGNYFLADSPKNIADKHYIRPSDTEFFEALDWLRGKLIAAE